MKLFKHQEEALKQTEGLQNIGVFHDMGCGKTYTGSEMMVRFGNSVNLIICQKSKVQDWVDHFNQNYSDNEMQDAYDLTIPKDFKWFIEYSKPEYEGNPIVGIINYELAWRRKELLNLKDFTLMLDESSLIQNKTSKRTKFIMKMHPDHVILLSGTPVGGKYENLWTQIHLLGWNINENLYNANYVNWKTIEVGRMKHRIVNKEDPYKNVDRLKRKMRENGAIFLKTEDVIDLPKQTFIPVRVNAPTEYKKFKKNGIITIDTKNLMEFHDDSDFYGVDVTPRIELVGDTTLTKLLYCRQICSQYNKNKLEAFEDLLQSTTDRLVVFYNFNEELSRLKMICQKYDRPTSEVNGHTKDLTAYEEHSSSVTLVQYQSGSMGINLQKANKSVYFSLPLSSEHFEQSKKRTHRINQTRPCFYYLLITQGTVEEDILKTLEEREDYTNELFKE